LTLYFFEHLWRGGNALLLPGLLAGVLAGFSCGMIGPYVVTRRIVFLVGAVAHMAVGGIGAAVLVRYHWRQWVVESGGYSSFEQALREQSGIAVLDRLLPIIGAALAPWLGAMLIGYIHHRVRDRIDTLIGALWAVGMSAGILMIKFTPGYQTELTSYLFGNLAMVGAADLWLMLAINLGIVICLAFMHKQLLSVCIDPQQAQLQGINVLMVNLLLLTLVALAVIAVMKVVGLILVLALLTLPAAVAGHHVRRLASMVLLATAAAVLLTTLPRIAAYEIEWRYPAATISPESAIVMAAAAAYLVSLLVRRIRQTRGA
jgi:zinc transport system permease protein